MLRSDHQNQSEREQEVRDQDANDFGNALETPAHPISELRANVQDIQSDSTGTYARGKEMSGDASASARAVTADEYRGISETGPVGTEVAGNSGGHVTGGDLTPHQDAGEALEEVRQNDMDYNEIYKAQHTGEVGLQREDLKPHANNPDEGTPPNPDGKEHTGGANAPQDQADDSAARAATPDASTTVRAAQDGDDRFLRLAAEFENYKRAVARRESELRERVERSVLEDFLPVLDNFQRAVQASQNLQGDANVRNLLMGVQGILMQMEQAMRAHNVEPMQTVGAKFDPLKHEAIEAVSNSGQPDGTVLSEAQRGYTFKGQVLRPAHVRVAA